MLCRQRNTGFPGHSGPSLVHHGLCCIFPYMGFLKEIREDKIGSPESLSLVLCAVRELLGTRGTSRTNHPLSYDLLVWYLANF